MKCQVRSRPSTLLVILANPAYHFKRIEVEAGPLSQWLFSALAEAGFVGGMCRHAGNASRY